MIVEHSDLGLQWADPWRGESFKVLKLGNDLRIIGRSPDFANKDSSSDLFVQFEKAPKQIAIGQQKSGMLSPEVLFANADTDEKLITFVKRFGPVVANRFQYGLRLQGRVRIRGRVVKKLRFPLANFLVAHQDLRELRKEHAIYRSALALVEMLGGDTFDEVSARKLHKIIALNIKNWPNQWKREKQLQDQDPTWQLHPQSLERIEKLSLISPDLVIPGPAGDFSRIILSNLLNVFHWNVYPNERERHDSIRFGIRPLLYALLRRQLFSPRELLFCKNTLCRNFFQIERAGQEYCGDVCSRQQRQRDYWQRQGKTIRQKRIKKKKSEMIATPTTNAN